MKIAKYAQMKERETIHGRTVYNSYIIDDGWNLPYTVIEEINIRIAKSQAEAYEEVCRLNKQHRGDWLTKEVAHEYADKAWAFRTIYGNQYIDEVRKLGEELREKYGLTDVEAVNILLEHNVSDYVQKYQMIKNLIPLKVDRQKICDRVVEEYWMSM